MKKFFIQLFFILVSTLQGAENWEGIKEDVVLQIAQVPGWCAKEKALLMMDLIKENNCQCCVEIGVFSGASFLPILKALQYNGSGMGFGIDAWDPIEAIKGFEPWESESTKWWSDIDFNYFHEETLKLIDENNLTDYCKIIKMRSQEAVNFFADETIDFLHLDGNHSAEFAFDDLRNYFSKVREGGYILLNDSNWSSMQQALAFLLERATIISPHSSSANYFLFRKNLEHAKNTEILLADEVVKKSWEEIKDEVVSQIEQIPGWCSKEKALLMMDLIKENKFQCCVEIGVFSGASFLPVVKALQYNGSGIAFGIDAWDPLESIKGFEPWESESIKWWSDIDFNYFHEQTLKLIDQNNLTDYCKIIKMRSQEAVSFFADETIDFLHLDGNHSAEFAFDDLRNYFSKVKEGGYILLNDSNWSSMKQTLDFLLERATVISPHSLSANYFLFRKNLDHAKNEEILLAEEVIKKNWEKIKDGVVSQIAQIPGWCAKEKALLMMDLIKENNCQCCVEIGVFSGASFFPIVKTLQYNGSGIAYGIDAWDPIEAIKGFESWESGSKKWWSDIDFNYFYEQTLKLIAENELSNYCKIIKLTSKEAINLFADETIDFLHLDGNHSAEFAFDDLRNYFPKVRDGGYILLNDPNWLNMLSPLVFLLERTDIVSPYSSSANYFLFRKNNQRAKHAEILFEKNN